MSWFSKAKKKVKNAFKKSHLSRTFRKSALLPFGGELAVKALDKYSKNHKKTLASQLWRHPGRTLKRRLNDLASNAVTNSDNTARVSAAGNAGYVGRTTIAGTGFHRASF